jgi:two-component system nitrogen regulation response regulator NtrX
VIAATNRDLEHAVAAGQFRQDLFYRLQVVTLRAPALRERKADIPALADRFLRAACVENNLPLRQFTASATRRLMEHDYPGNVRELRNLVERLVILTRGTEIDADDVAQCLPQPRRSSADTITLHGTLRNTMEVLERQLVRQALEGCSWRMTDAAQALGLERSHLYKKLKSLGIERPD